MLCNVLFRTPREERSIYIFMAICTNTGFIGLPVISSIYGSDSVLFCGIFIAVLAFFVYSVGFGALVPRKPGEKAKIPWKAMMNPAMVASVVSIALVLLGFEFPPVAEKGLSLVGNITAPVAMLMVGIIIANARLADVFKEWRLYPFIVIRQLIVPAALFLGAECFGHRSSAGGRVRYHVRYAGRFYGTGICADDGARPAAAGTWHRAFDAFVVCGGAVAGCVDDGDGLTQVYCFNQQFCFRRPCA